MVLTKYGDARPLYHQDMIGGRIWVEIRRAVLINWTIWWGSLVQRLNNRLGDRLLGRDVIRMDDIRQQVLEEPGKTTQSRSYVWVRRGGAPLVLPGRLHERIDKSISQGRDCQHQPVLAGCDC